MPAGEILVRNSDNGEIYVVFKKFCKKKKKLRKAFTGKDYAIKKYNYFRYSYSKLFVNSALFFPFLLSKFLAVHLSRAKRESNIMSLFTINWSLSITSFEYDLWNTHHAMKLTRKCLYVVKLKNVLIHVNIFSSEINVLVT